MNEEQRARLKAVVDELDSWPTPELIVECARLICIMKGKPYNSKHFENGLAGGIAAQKLMAYIETLRNVEAQREHLGRIIHGILEKAEALWEEHPKESISLQVEVGQLSGKQEALFHMWSVCVGRVERLLPVAARAAGHKVSAADTRLLQKYRHIRDYYEHLEDRLPGRPRFDAKASTKVEGDLWTYSFGLKTDNEGRFVFGDSRIEFSTEALRKVENVLQRNWEDLRTVALENLRKHFESAPERIPNSADLRYAPLVKVRVAENLK